MLENVFSMVFNMSIAASLAAAVIIGLRPILHHRMPKTFSYALWAVVLIRLILPFYYSSTFSIYNVLPAPAATIIQSAQNLGAMTYVPYDMGMMPIPQINAGSDAINNTVNSSLPGATPEASANPMQVVMFVFTQIWIIGALSLLLFSVIVYFRLVGRVKTAVLYKDNGIISELSYRLKLKRKVQIYTSDRINTPLVCGFIGPRIMLPLSLVQTGQEADLQHIILHELIHIKRFDYIIKPLSVLALCVHWFNPVIWFSFILAQKDMEMSCDEGVMALSDRDIRSSYAASLINLAVKQNSLLNGGLLAFGESNIKSRIKGIVNYKKPRFWMIMAAVIIVAALSGVLLTNRMPQHPPLPRASSYNAEALFKSKTPYVGNNSKVADIINNLPFAGVRQKISLQTQAPPYGITVSYDFSTIDMDPKQIEGTFRANAAIMFALIDNVDGLIFTVSGNNAGPEYRYTRAEVQQSFTNDLREYAKNNKEFEALLKSLTFKLLVYPEKYTTLMSSTPGIRIAAEYPGSVGKVRYSTANGGLLTWSSTTGQISEGGQTIDLPYGIPVYWSPLESNGEVFQGNDNVVTVTLLDEKGLKIDEKLLTIKYDGSFYTAQSSP